MIEIKCIKLIITGLADFSMQRVLDLVQVLIKEVNNFDTKTLGLIVNVRKMTKMFGSWKSNDEL